VPATAPDNPFPIHTTCAAGGAGKLLRLISPGPAEPFLREVTMEIESTSTDGPENQRKGRARKGQQDEAFTPREMGVSAEEILRFIERVERLEEEKSALNDDIKDVLTEAKGRGYSAKALRTIIKLRKLDPEERQASEAILDLYMNAIGMI